MDNLDKKLGITEDTTKKEVIDYAVTLYDIHKPSDLTKEEVIKYAGSTWEHSKRVHFYLNKLGISIDDESETPHDLAGKGNKLEWEVMRGFIYTKEDKKEDSGKKKIFEKSLEIHRGQMHHQMWNDNDSPDEWLMYGAIDAVCSLLEDREYQNGVHYWDEILKVIPSYPSDGYQKEWMICAVKKMREVTPLLEDFKIKIFSILNGNKKNSKENNNCSN